MVAYCRTGQETHSWRILSCPPVSGATMTDQDCNETTKQRSIITYQHRGQTGRVRSGHFASLVSILLVILLLFNKSCCCFKSLNSSIYDLGLHVVALLTVKTRN